MYVTAGEPPLACRLIGFSPWIKINFIIDIKLIFGFEGEHSSKAMISINSFVLPFPSILSSKSENIALR